MGRGNVVPVVSGRADRARAESEARARALKASKAGAVSEEAEVVVERRERKLRARTDATYRLFPDGASLEVVVTEGQRHRFAVSELLDEKKAAHFAALYAEICAVAYRAAKATVVDAIER